jgi:Flp pilus assembly protein CpaB
MRSGWQTNHHRRDFARARVCPTAADRRADVSETGRRRWRLVACATTLAVLFTAALALAAIGPAAPTRARIATSQSSPVASPAATSSATSTDLQPHIADALPTGKRAATATFRDVSPADAPLRAGDVADVVAVFRKERANEQTGLSIDEDTVALIRGLTVLAVSDAETLAAPTADERTSAFRLRTFTVAASPEETQLIALARQIGELRIGKCSTAECDDRALTAP